MMTQRLETAAVVGPADALPGYNHQIKTCKLVLVVSKTLSDHPLNPITLDGTSTVLFRYGQTQTGVGHIIGSGKHQEIVIYGTLAIAKNPTKFVGFQ